MFARLTKFHARLLVAATIVITLAGLFVAHTAFARIMTNTIDAVAVVAGRGRHLIVTGPIACNQKERAELRVTVTQRETGAVAEGYTVFTCTVEIQQWEVHAVAQGKATFEEGPATAVAVGTTSFRGAATDAHQWLVDITLVGE